MYAAKALVAIIGAGVTSALAIFPPDTDTYTVLTIASAVITAALVYDCEKVFTKTTKSCHHRKTCYLRHHKVAKEHFDLYRCPWRHFSRVFSSRQPHFQLHLVKFRIAEVRPFVGPT